MAALKHPHSRRCALAGRAGRREVSGVRAVHRRHRPQLWVPSQPKPSVNPMVLFSADHGNAGEDNASFSTRLGRKHLAFSQRSIMQHATG